MRNVYLDHNATTPLHPKVRQALTEAFDLFGNPSSIHELGRKARREIELTRQTLAEFINADPEEIIFVGSGSEANNTVINSLSCCSSHCSLKNDNRSEVITTRIEHPCVLEAARCVADRGAKVTYLSVNKHGLVNPDELQEKISDKTVLVSIMMANNEIGTIQDIQNLAEIARKKGVFFHTDAVQAVGKIPVDVKKIKVDFLSFSAHKIYGPKGIGALYVKKGSPFCPFIRGGHQEKGRRAGTENTLGIVAFKESILQRKIEMIEEEIRLNKLKTFFQTRLESEIDDLEFNGMPGNSLAGTLNVSFDGVEGEALALYLDLEGIAVSTGSACSSGSLDPSHVLLATGISPEKAHGSIRFSLGRSTTEEDINYTVDKLIPILAKLREISTVYKPRNKNGK
ncbi:MAG: cysteine desulfurase family protein [Candidatus Omnitrophica bacterium]|nr:cysteine desulfurase family protein [Candidatus Omnitrophota bacterium]